MKIINESTIIVFIIYFQQFQQFFLQYSLLTLKILFSAG